jgi:maleate isomerase
VTTIGVITPHAAAGAEAEWPLMVGERIIAIAARIPAPGRTVDDPGDPPSSPSSLRALATPQALDHAVACFAQGSIDAIGYTSTSTGYVLRHRAERALLNGLSHRWNVPAASTSAAAVTALRTLRIQRVALVHPPWFGDEPNALGATYFRDQGFHVTGSRLADLPRDPSKVEPDDIITWISTNVTDEAQAVFIGGNGFRSVAAIARLETQVERPVVTSNQALLWALLGEAHAHIAVHGYGALFEQRYPLTQPKLN